MTTTLSRAALAGVLLLGGGGSAFAAASAGSSFLRQAIRGDIAETEIGQLAQQKSTDADVKSFGQELVNDHSQSKTEATSLAQSMKVTVPTSAPRMAQTEYRKLSKLSGPAFDKAFLAQPIGDGVTSLGIPVGFGLIILTIVLTGVYVIRANAEFDKLTREIVAEAGQ